LSDRSFRIETRPRQDWSEGAFSVFATWISAVVADLGLALASIPEKTLFNQNDVNPSAREGASSFSAFRFETWLFKGNAHGFENHDVV